MKKRVCLRLVSWIYKSDFNKSNIEDVNKQAVILNDSPFLDIFLELGFCSWKILESSYLLGFNYDCQVSNVIRRCSSAVRPTTSSERVRAVARHCLLA